MLNLILAVLVPFLVTTAEEQTVSNIEVVEVFRAETTEELEAALTDGYPMTWLEEILNDESIPEEDRYWLDCRVRAVITQDLHLFFDRNNNPIEIEADRIRYGESYWQEHFIIDPPGELPRGEQNTETGLWGESGFVYNRFGEKTGELALLDPSINLSRDGSIAVLAHWGSAQQPVFGSGYLYFLYDDGSYVMYPRLLLMYEISLSQSGNYTVVRERSQNSTDPITLFNRYGEVVWKQNTTGTTAAGINPEIFPDDAYCLVPSTDRNPLVRYCQIISINNGETIDIRNPEISSRVSISAIGSHFFVGEDLISIAGVDAVWSVPEDSRSDFGIMGNSSSDDGSLIAITFGKQHSRDTYFYLYNKDQELLQSETINYGDYMRLSPNGAFAMTGPHDFGEIQLPFRVWQISGDR